MSFFMKEGSKSLLSKILLVGLIAVFVILFGGYFSQTKELPDTTSTPIASVNNDPITMGQVQMLLKGQMDRFGGKNKNIPKEIQQLLQKQVIDELTANLLWSQEAAKLGLQTTDEELQKRIKEDLPFKKDGKFNVEYYLDTFLPYYQENFGLSFEDSYRQGLQGEKLQKWVKKHTPVFNTDSNLMLAYKNIKVAVEWIELATPNTESQKTESQATAPLAPDQLLSELASFPNGTPDGFWLKQHQLKIEKTELLPIQEILIKFGDSSDDLLACGLAQLKKFCPNLISWQGKPFAMRIIDYQKNQTPDKNVTIETVQKEIKTENEYLFQQFLEKHLKSEAKIKYYQ